MESTSRVVTNLGPQCLQCRKRRVKCDSTTPACRRCRDKGMKCPGYQKALKFVSVEPPATSRTTSNVVQPQHSLDISPKWLRSFPQDLHELAMLDSVRNYNTYVLPYRTPGHKPFTRQRMYESVPWQVVPEVLRFILILTIKTLQTSRNGLDPSLCSDVRYYRGLCLHRLNQQLHNATDDPFGTALSAIILLVGADLYLEHDMSWLSHLQAAARVINLRGGLYVCMTDLPFLRAPLVNFMVIDILSATTCHSAVIFPSFADFQRAVELYYLLPDLQGDLLANSCLCPWPVLRAIVQTNLLRAGEGVSCSQSPLNKSVDSLAALQDRDGVLNDLQSFDATMWTTTIIRGGQPLPEPPGDAPSVTNISALKSIAVCYQSAAILYFLLSSFHGDDKQRQILATGIKQRVDSTMNDLFALSSTDDDGPLHGQLWKFLTWPMVISLYASVGWDVCHQKDDLATEMDRVERRAKLLRSRSLLIALDHMRKVKSSKDAAAPMTWEWDHGFMGRHSFAI